MFRRPSDERRLGIHDPPPGRIGHSRRDLRSIEIAVIRPQFSPTELIVWPDVSDLDQARYPARSSAPCMLPKALIIAGGGASLGPESSNALATGRQLGLPRFGYGDDGIS